MRQHPLPSRGFTLIELIIVVVVVGIMAAALAPLMLSSLRAYNEVYGNIVVLDKLRYATERLAREIREVKYASSTATPATTCPDGSSDKFCFTAMNPNGLTFTRTFHEFSGTPDATVSVATTTTCTNPSCVTLTYSSPIGGGTQVLTDELNGITGLSFSYFTDDGINTTADPALVRSVQISLTLWHNGNQYPQITRVELKNR